MRIDVKTWIGAAAAGAFAIVAVGVGAGAQTTAQGTKLSEKSVTTLMDYAWQILPSKFTTPSGKVIEVDKTKRAQNVVPVEVARDIIRVAYNSAHAQICELWEEQQANYDALMRREIAKKAWSDQQLLYINTLHRMTIHAVAGKLRVEEADGVLKVFLEPIKPGEGNCSDDRKAKTREAIQAYLALDAPKDGKGAAAQPAAQPVSAPGKK